MSESLTQEQVDALPDGTEIEIKDLGIRSDRPRRYIVRVGSSGHRWAQIPQWRNMYACSLGRRVVGSLIEVRLVSHAAARGEETGHE